MREVLPAPVHVGEASPSLVSSCALRGERRKAAAVKVIPHDGVSVPLPGSLRELEQVWANSLKELRFGFVLAGWQLVVIMLCVYNYLLHTHIISQEQAAAMARRSALQPYTLNLLYQKKKQTPNHQQKNPASALVSAG